MQLLRDALQIAAIATMLFGPLISLVHFWTRESRVPGAILYICATGAVCISIFWPAMYAADVILESQFREIVPSGSWTPTDEAIWTPEQKRIVSAYFADGGRNVFFVAAPVLILAYSTVLWLIAVLYDRLRTRFSS